MYEDETKEGMVGERGTYKEVVETEERGWRFRTARRPDWEPEEEKL